MNMTGKILFFNVNEGKGIIITSTKQKLGFTVSEWDDFDTMPSLGLEVSFVCNDDIPESIVSLANAPAQSTQPESEKVKTNTEEEPEPSEENTEDSALPQDDTHEEKYQEEDLEEETSGKSTSYEEDEYDEYDEEELEEHTPEHFENNDEIATIEDIEEELGPREESVTLTLNLSKAVDNYFKIIETNIERRTSYLRVNGRLDYLLIRRFLWTTFNNLSEIDLHIINPVIRNISDDLKAMARVYDDYIIKTKHPPLAYEEVFLSCQAEYVKIKDGAEKTIKQLTLLRNNEKHVGGVLKVKKETLSQNINTEEFDILKQELKSLNGAYVDIVHMMAELDERYKHDMALLKEFEDEYRDDFYDLFKTASVKYRKSLVDILSAQAFLLDEKLWNQAKTSKAVKAHFHKASIEGEFNTRTYLKYYLDSFDSKRVNDENQKLFDLYKYLCSLQKDNVMIVTSTPEDAMEFSACISSMDKSISVKALIDEKSALKWAMKNSIKVLVVEDQLARMSVFTFLSYYRKYILVNPKIILLGNKRETGDYTISKILSKNISPKVLAQNVKELLASENEKEEKS